MGEIEALEIAEQERMYRDYRSLRASIEDDDGNIDPDKINMEIVNQIGGYLRILNC